MKIVLLLIVGILLAAPGVGAEPVAALRFPEEQAAWVAIAARFSEAPKVKSDNSKTFELAVAGVRDKPKGEGSASIIVNKATGHVVQVTSNSASFGDDQFEHFAKFTELQALSLFHNGNFTGVGLAKLAKLPKLERITLAGGGLNDAGMAEAAKILTMRELRAWHAKFSDAGVAALRGHPALESIQVGPSWAPLLTDKTIESLAQCPRLKKLGITETWLTWEGGLKHLAARKEPLAELSLGNCIIEPADVERLRREMPATKISWEGFGSGAPELKKAWLRKSAETWIPKELLDRVIAAGEEKSAGEKKPR